MKADLHIHTTESDGTWAPSRIAQEAKDRGISVIAITDHDTVAAIGQAQDNAPPGVEVIPGIEISTSIGQSGEVHILGYWIRPDHTALKEYIQNMHSSRFERAQRIVHKLNQEGISITFDDVLKHTPREIVSRTHIAAALVQAGYVKTKAQAFDRWIGVGSPAYVPRPKMLPEEAIDLIIASGGVPVLAHPGLLHDLSLIKRLAEHRLIGLEVVHSTHSARKTAYFREVAQELGLLPSGGSDCHGPGGKDEFYLGNYTIPVEWVEALRTQIA